MTVVNIFAEIKRQLPRGVRDEVNIAVESDPYFVRAEVTLELKRRPDLVIKTRLEPGLKLPELAIAEVCIWA